MLSNLNHKKVYGKCLILIFLYFSYFSVTGKMIIYAPKLSEYLTANHHTVNKISTHLLYDLYRTTGI